MSKIVVGIFNDADNAQEAKHQLIKKGFNENEVDLAKGSSSRYYVNEQEDHEEENGIERFFRKLFKGDDRETNRYKSAAEKGWIITVHTDSDEEARLAADVLDSCDAVDVDEQQGRYHETRDVQDSFHEIDQEHDNDIGPGAGIGVSTPTGDTYVDTNETHSGIVKGEVYDRSLRRDNQGEDNIIDEEVKDEDADERVVKQDVSATDTDRHTKRAGDENFNEDSVDEDVNMRDNSTLLTRGDTRLKGKDRDIADTNEDEDPVFAPGDDSDYLHRDEEINYRDADREKEEHRTIPVIEEKLHVDKKKVQTGGVRVRSRIIEKPFEERIRLREEHVRVDRHPVDREATDEELKNMREESIEITETAEVAEVKRDARVVEEVSVDKTVDHRDETVSNNSRNTEVEVEDLDDERRNKYE